MKRDRTIATKGRAGTWHVYILECADGTLYTGSTSDVARRVREHNSSMLGAKYTKARRPASLRYSSSHESRSAALKEEARIKALTRGGKNELLARSTIRL